MALNNATTSCGAAVLFLTLTACSNETSAGESARWSANPDRLGPIRANTAFDQQALAAALPEFQVSATTAMAEGEAYPIMEARRADAENAELVFDGDDGRLLAVTIRVPGLVGASADIGQTGADAGFSHNDCFPGVEERSGDIVCQDPRPTGLTYWIEIDHAGPDGELPPAAVIDAGRIYEIQWVPVPG